MPRRSFLVLFAICALAALIFVLNDLAFVYHLYWSTWWYDLVVHFLGGMCVAALGLWFLSHSNHSRGTLFFLTAAALFAFGAGAAWEVFEYVSGMYVAQHNIVSDTTLDFVMDTLGGVAAFVFMRPFLLRPKENKV